MWTFTLLGREKTASGREITTRGRWIPTQGGFTRSRGEIVDRAFQRWFESAGAAGRS